MGRRADPSAAEALIGTQVNRLSILSLLRRDSKGRYIMLCECECGKQIPVATRNLIGERAQKSCGCSQREYIDSGKPFQLMY